MFLLDLLSRLVPSVSADDPMTTLKEKCNELPKAQEFMDRLKECTERVNSKQQTTETCVQELMDYLHVVDNCVAKDLFKYLK
ncbi:hypothetical protein FQR65_LT03458 [Abscondita terminalis]|nr:hypothetical protein FQR65_LT03458 [Abscondita terminalis]